MPTLTIRYDQRAAPFGRPHADQYTAMLEQVRWADAAGLDPEIAAGSNALVESAVLPRLRDAAPDVTP